MKCGRLASPRVTTARAAFLRLQWAHSPRQRGAQRRASTSTRDLGRLAATASMRRARATRAWLLMIDWLRWKSARRIASRPGCVSTAHGIASILTTTNRACRRLETYSSSVRERLFDLTLGVQTYVSQDNERYRATCGSSHCSPFRQRDCASASGEANVQVREVLRSRSG